ncbi:unnamed protein product, partial [Polarella glacialis]
MEPKLVASVACTSVVLLVATRWLLVWLAGARPPRLFAAGRASAAARRLETFLRCTGSFDGLLKGFECSPESGDGAITGFITAARPLLTDLGLLDEGSVALLLDSLTGFALWASGYAGFVSAELRMKVEEQAQEGERLLIRAWLKEPPVKPSDARLRETAVLAFELRRVVGGEKEGFKDGALLAHGEQTMVCIAPFFQRVLWSAKLYIPLLFEFMWQREMEQLKLVAKYSVPVEEVTTLGDLLGLKREPVSDADFDSRKTTFSVYMAPRLLNV